MKKIVFTFCLVVAIAMTSFATDIKPNLKFGKPTNEEMSLTSCPFDPDADAFYLSRTADWYYVYQQDIGFQIKYEFKHRIKVLTEKGKDEGDISIIYYDTGDIRKHNEAVDGISAVAYNLENGKVVKSSLSKQNIFRETISDNLKCVKFSIPNVKAGSVIEYKYTITSKRVSEIRSWFAQCAIPVAYSRLELVVPEFFDFKYDIRGAHPINVKRDVGVMSLPYGIGQAENVRTFNILFEGEKAQAMKDDDFVWCIDDYTSHIDFTLSQVNFFGKITNYSRTWRDVDDTLMKSRFGDNLKMSNPFKDEMASLNINQYSTNTEKVECLLVFLRKKMKWNGEYRLSTTTLKDDIKNGQGSNASLNFVLMSMMRDASIDCKPVLLSTRKNGRILYNPSLDAVTTFIIGFTENNNSIHYIDASALYGGVDVLPLPLCTDFAHMYEASLPKDLTRLSKNSERSNIECSINDDGLLSATVQTILTGQNARIFRTQYSSESDSLNAVNDMEKENGIKIKSLNVTNLHSLANEVRIQMQFEKQYELTGDMIYLNPLVIPSITNNPFTAETRSLPVEMDFIRQVNIMSVLSISGLWEIAELPNSSKVSMMSYPKNTCTYRIFSSDNGKISTSYRFALDNLVFKSSEYGELKSFWAKVVEYNDNMIVLKKK